MKMYDPIIYQKVENIIHSSGTSLYTCTSEVTPLSYIYVIVEMIHHSETNL